MPFQAGLPAALARWGLKVETVPGWETRGSSAFTPRGALCHWTAGPANSKTRPSLNICTNGRPDLPGPLCNVYLDRNGVAVVVAAGRPNHAGAGNWRGLTGNSVLWGTEAEAASAADFTAAQRAAYPRVNAAYATLSGFGADMVAGHSEFALPAGRKVDVNGYTMAQMRAQVAALLANPTAAAQALIEEDDFMPLFANRAEFEQAVNRAVLCLTPTDRKNPWLVDMAAGTDAKTGAIATDLAALRKEVAALRAAATATPAQMQAVAVDAEDVAEAITATPSFVDALAEAVARKLADRLQQ
jgi:hypothetical protein